jgi:sulfite exporter TauE/SafE
MLASITPLGQRGRDASWRRTVTAYVVASTAAAAAVGALLGLLGATFLAGESPRWLLIGLAAAALLAALSDLRGRPPGIRRQVDETWLDSYRDWVVGLGYGAQLGIGAMTIATSASVYLVWLFELATGRAWAGAVVGAAFGLARAVPVFAARTAVDAASLRSLHRRVELWRVPLQRITVLAQIVAAISLVAVAA